MRLSAAGRMEQRVARMLTQGSWRPFCVMSVSPPLRSTVLRGDGIDNVGFPARRATTGWPVARVDPTWVAAKSTAGQKG
jgi:hypothetical protein